jgi:hypothetical protein
MLDPALGADAVEQHSPGAGPEPAGEDLAVVGQDLRRRAIPVDRGQQRITRRTRRRAGHDPRRHRVPRVVIDARHDLGLRPVNKPDTADDALSATTPVARARSQRL